MISTLFIKFLLWATLVSASPSNGLHLKVHGIKSNKGKILIGVYKNDGGFPVIGKQYKGYEIEIKNYQASIFIKDLPKGTYAIGVCHDINDNDKMDKNFFGVPTEPYGFSKNAKAYMSSPDFEDASFQFNGFLEMEIKLNTY